MHQQDIAPIEHATIAAVSPQMVHTLPGWLLPMDEGTIGRSHSAVPLSHAQANAALTNIEVIVQAYAQHGMQAKFRLPDVPAWGQYIAEASWPRLGRARVGGLGPSRFTARYRQVVFASRTGQHQRSGLVPKTGFSQCLEIRLLAIARYS